MATHLENINRLIEIKAQFSEFKSLKEECLLVFSDSIYVTMDFIEDKVNNEWHRLYQLVHVSCRYDIKYFFNRMKNGNINRKEFRALMADTIDAIEKKYAFLENELKKAEAQVESDYNSFFNKDTPSHQKGAAKFIFYALSQPEAKAILLKYLES